MNRDFFLTFSNCIEEQIFQTWQESLLVFPEKIKYIYILSPSQYKTKKYNFNFKEFSPRI